MLKAYYRLTKPGIIYSNVFTAAAGFLFATRWHINYRIFVSLLVGTSLVIASGCVYNNYLDREIDKKMARTKGRALASGQVPPKHALIYATVLTVAGFTTLALFTNYLTVGVGLVALVDYVALYGLAKRYTSYGTQVGSIAGAASIVAGYTAATGRLDLEALLLFAILAVWQMPHFYSIALYRSTDYSAAGIPTLPSAKGPAVARRHVLMYITAFILLMVLPAMLGYTGYVYSIVMVGLGLYWLWLGWNIISIKNSREWGRRMFLYSLVVIVSLSVMLAVGPLLP